MSIISDNKHYVGMFEFEGELVQGEIIYNKKNGLILLNIIKKLTKENQLGRSYGNIKIIKGELNNGVKVTLFNNKCVNNNTRAFSIQNIMYKCDYLVWANKYYADALFNKLNIQVSNAVEWSGMTKIVKESVFGIKVDWDKKDFSFEMYGSKITFSTTIGSDDKLGQDTEKISITERLLINIESERKQDITYFLKIKEKLLTMICFAIKDNVNIEEYMLFDNDNCYEDIESKYIPKPLYFLSSEKRNDIMGMKKWDYNFFLNQLNFDSAVIEKLEKLEPIFNLYMSLFKYRDMPAEMVYLNLVQAIETYHSRFYYEDNKDNFITSVQRRFSTYPNYDMYKKLLLSDTQMDKNCRYIILVSRINDLLIMSEYLFYDFYYMKEDWAQKIADTRHYYTHYGKSKESKALKGEELLDAIFQLRVILEYYICKELGIDNTEKIRNELVRNNAWKSLKEHK